ncbi:MAG: HAMP domain-containing sensor histidine kinase [Cyclobacteriaceae bacterium]
MCHISLKIKQEGQNIFIYFSDNGIGIEETHLEKIFSMFYRASHHSQGSGLGLYIAKEAVSKLGGSIAVQSQVGIGTTFTITLPNLY